MRRTLFEGLTRPPLNLEVEEMLGAVVERLLKAMREARPGNVRQFFALANQHIRWELNDLARRLDEQPQAVELREGLVPAVESSGSALSPDGRRILAAIEDLPDDEREVFGLMVDVAGGGVHQWPLLAPGCIAFQPYRGHAHGAGRRQVAGDVVEHGGLRAGHA